MSKATVNPKALAEALARATGAIERRKTYPILMCVRLVAGDGELIVEATDQARVISVSIEAEGEFDPICVDYGRLIGVVATVKDRDELAIAVGAGNIVVSSGRSRFTLPFLAADAWPTIEQGEWQTTFEISGPKFARLMTALEPAISDEVTRYYLCGIYLTPGAVLDQRQDGCLTAVATDGHKLYARHIEIPGIDARMAPIIVPRVATAGIAKIFGERETIEVSCNASKLRVRVDGTTYVTSLIEGNYPDWRRVMPKEESAISYDTAALRAAASTVEAAKSSSKDGKAIKLIFGDEETELEAKDFNDPAFSGNDVVRHSLLGKPASREVGLNVNYLIEMLDRLDAETVELAIPASNQGPVGLRSATHTDRAIVIMSMRV